MAELAISAALEDDGTVAITPSAVESPSSAMPPPEPEAAANDSAPVDQSSLVVAAIGAAWPTAIIDPAVAALCSPLSKADPCGPDLDLAGDPDYLNFFAQTEGLL